MIMTCHISLISQENTYQSRPHVSIFKLFFKLYFHHIRQVFCHVSIYVYVQLIKVKLCENSQLIFTLLNSPLRSKLKIILYGPAALKKFSLNKKVKSIKLCVPRFSFSERFVNLKNGSGIYSLSPAVS